MASEGEPPSRRGPGPSTRSVHGGERGRLPSDAVTTPIYQTSTFWFRDSAELREYQEGRLEREEYGRYGNPTWKAVERKLCDLEGAEEAVLFASGMCAATTLFLALLPRGSHLVVTSDCYRRTRQFIREYLTKLDVETTVIDPADTRQLAAALRDQTTLFFTECPTNPYLRVIDVPEAVRVCHARGVRVVVDATFASPVCYRPLADGADFVIHSATKYLGGHNDLLAGVVAGSAEQVAPVRRAVGVLGGVLDAHAAWLLLRGLKTLALRMERHNANALAVARWLRDHDAVDWVNYPGLDEDPYKEVADRVLTGGYGALITFGVKGGLEAGKAFIESLELFTHLANIGDAKSLAIHNASTTHSQLNAEELEAAGVTEDTVRLSVGIEHIDDIIADLEQALAAARQGAAA